MRKEPNPMENALTQEVIDAYIIVGMTIVAVIIIFFLMRFFEDHHGEIKAWIRSMTNKPHRGKEK